MNRRSFPVFCLFLLIYQVAQGQHSEWLKKADSLRDIDPARSAEYVELILGSDSTMMDELIFAGANQLKGLSKMYEYQFEESLDYFGKAYDVLVKYEDTQQNQRILGKLYMDIGRNFVWQSKFDTALTMLLRANTIFEEGGYEKEQAESLNSLAIVYIRYSGEEEKALQTFLESLNISINQRDTASMARIMQNVGQIYNLIGQNDSALFYLRISNHLVEKTQDFRSLAIGANIIAAVFQDLNQLDSSEFYFRRAINLDISNQDSVGLMHDYNQLSSLLLLRQKFDEAKSYGLLAFQNTKDLLIKSESAETLSKVFTGLGDFKKALFYFMEFKTYSDSARSKDQRETIAELQTQYETAQKEKEIQLAQNELRKNAIKQQYLTIITILVLLGSLTIFIIQKQKSKLKHQVLSGEISDLRFQIKTLLGQYEGEFNMDLGTLNSKLVNPLSDREFDIFKHIFTQKSNQEIADELFVSINTVKTHLKNIYSKLGVTNRKEALEAILKDA